MARASPPLGRMLGRYWLAVFPLARMELRRWSARAGRIPDDHLRGCAQRTLTQEHLNAEGAALFATLAPWTLTRPMVRALVAFQTLFDYLDTITEVRPDQQDTRHLHQALVYALDPAMEHPLDWYAHHPHTDDGGYVTALAQTCRSALARLPSYCAVAPCTTVLATRAGQVQALNHEHPAARAALLRQWATTQPETAQLPLLWWEIAAAASSSLSIFVLLALATSPAITTAQAQAAERGYCTSLAALNTLLESLVDLSVDRRTGDQSFAGYYPSGQAALRIPKIAQTARDASTRLPNPARHHVILAGMVAFYLSKQEAWLPAAAPAAAGVLAAIGSPARTLMRVLRVRRFA